MKDLLYADHLQSTRGGGEMNREKAMELARVLEHWANGGKIEGRHDCCDWVAIDADRFFPEMGVRYRIAPKPLECWVVFNSDGSIYAARSEPFEGDANFRVDGVHMREVTE